jgi:hypothetical protein
VTVEATVSVRTAFGQPGTAVADEFPHLLAATDLAVAGIVDHHLSRPYRLQSVGVAVVQGGDELRDRIRLTRGAGLPARQRLTELRKPRHLKPLPEV